MTEAEATPPLSSAPPVPAPVLLRLRVAVALVYGTDLMLVGGLLSALAGSPKEPLALALAAGHGLAMLIGASWTAGALIAANRTPRTMIASTILLSPLRYIGGIAVLLIVAATLEDQRLITAMVLAFIVTQVLSHIIQALVTFRLSESRPRGPSS